LKKDSEVCRTEILFSIGGHIPLISEANFFIRALAVPLTSQDVNGLDIKAKFLANLLEKNCFNHGFNNTSTKIYHI